MEKPLKNKTCLITGATSGIGRSAAIKLSLMGANIVFIARNKEKAKALSEEINSLCGSKPTEIIADLSSQKEIKNAAEEFLKLQEPLHILLNNAGIVNNKRKESIDGFEEVFAVNHLAYFALTLRLLERLKENSPSRIVNVSSAAHKFIKNMNWDDFQFKANYKTFLVYGQSKLANILFTKKLSKLVEQHGVTVNCLHPGWVSTSLGTQNEKGSRSLLGGLISLFSPLMAKSSEKGAETSIYLCSAEEVSKVSGEYFVDCKVKGVSEEANNSLSADKLWEISSELTGLTYP